MGSFREDLFFSAFHKRQEMYSCTRERDLHFARMGLRSQVKVVWLHKTTNGLQATDYLLQLREEGLTANQMGMHKFLQKHRETNNIERRPGSGRPTKMTAAVKALVERQMRVDNETTAVQLHTLLLPNRP